MVAGSSSVRRTQQFIDRRVVQSFQLGDLAAAADPSFIDQALPVKCARQRNLQRVVVLTAATVAASRQDTVAVRPNIGPYDHLADAAFSDFQRDESRQFHRLIFLPPYGNRRAGCSNPRHTVTCSSANSAPMVPGINSQASSCQPLSRQMISIPVTAHDSLDQQLCRHRGRFAWCSSWALWLINDTIIHALVDQEAKSQQANSAHIKCFSWPSSRHPVRLQTI